jgi:hypothetical protein
VSIEENSYKQKGATGSSRLRTNRFHAIMPPDGCMAIGSPVLAKYLRYWLSSAQNLPYDQVLIQ